MVLVFRLQVCHSLGKSDTLQGIRSAMVQAFKKKWCENKEDEKMDFN